MMDWKARRYEGGGQVGWWEIQEPSFLCLRVRLAVMDRRRRRRGRRREGRGEEREGVCRERVWSRRC